MFQFLIIAITIKMTEFRNNNCTLNGGGGIDVGFLFFDTERPEMNNIYFQECKFLNNSADYGGGLHIYYSTSGDFSNLENNIEFHLCTWKENTAKFGSAVNVGTHTRDTLNRGYLPLPVFKDSTFESNIAQRSKMVMWKSFVIGK